eukprot:5104611-Alexandrium_andersonii.AAC.1
MECVTRSVPEEPCIGGASSRGSWSGNGLVPPCRQGIAASNLQLGSSGASEPHCGCSPGVRA